jgi:hypothetical protein
MVERSSTQWVGFDAFAKETCPGQYSRYGTANPHHRRLRVIARHCEMDQQILSFETRMS